MKFMMLMIPAVYQGGKKVDPNFVPDPKKVEAKQPPPRKIARRHAAPPQRLAPPQQQFAWFGPRMW